MMTLTEYDRRDEVLTAIWRQIHRATDNPESSVAVRAIAAARRSLVQYRLLAPGAADPDRATVEKSTGRVLEEFAARGILSAEEVEALSRIDAHLKAIAVFADPSAEKDREGAALVVICLPAVWRAMEALLDELRACRTAAFYLRRLRRALRVAAVCGAVAVAIGALSFVNGWLDPQGWRVTYYLGTHFRIPIALRFERAANAYYGIWMPAFPALPDRWSARWEGRLLVPQSADYTFVVQADDGYRFYLDGKLLLDRWRVQGWRRSMGKVTLALDAGNHTVRVEHFDRDGEAAIRVRWAGGPIPRDTVLGKPYVMKP